MTTVTKKQIVDFINANPDLVSVKQQCSNMKILKYKRKVFWRNLWTPELCEMRGTVVDNDFNIVQRPFTKIFNAGESAAPQIADTDIVHATVKVNGFMAAVTWHNDQLLISTTGSLISDFVLIAEKYLAQKEWFFKDYPDFTFIFEITDPSDPHIIEEQQGVWLLGVRRKVWESTNTELAIPARLNVLAEIGGFKRPQVYMYKQYCQIKSMLRTARHEGFVVVTVPNNSSPVEVKLKSPFYLTTKFLGRKSEDKLVKLLTNKEQARKIIDEEFYPVVDHLSDPKTIDKFISMSDQERFAYLRTWFGHNVLGTDNDSH